MVSAHTPEYTEETQSPEPYEDCPDYPICRWWPARGPICCLDRDILNKKKESDSGR